MPTPEPFMSQTSLYRWIFPAELTAAVLSNFDLQDDVEDLIACSSVSRTWNELTRPMLFSAICITFTHNSKEKDGKDNKHNYGALTELSRISDLLMQDAPRVLPIVKKLQLVQEHRDAKLEMTDCTLLWGIISLFPSLKQLCLTDIMMTPPNHSNSPGYVLVNPTRLIDIEELEYVVHWSDFDQGVIEHPLWLGLFGFVGKFNLTLGEVECNIADNDLRQENIKFVLDTIRIGGIKTQAGYSPCNFLHALKKTPSVEVLESLDLSYCTRKALQELPRFLDSLSKPLVHFGCDLRPLCQADGK